MPRLGIGGGLGLSGFVSRVLRGVSAGLSTALAALIVTKALAGTAAGVAATAAQLTVAKPLAGTAAGVATADAALTVVPSWEPATPGGLLLRYDALSVPSHALYQESSGTPPGSTLADTDGETVGTCRNKVSDNDHLIQATSGNRPTFDDDGLAGGPCMIFNGSTNYLRVVDSVTASTFSLLWSFGLDSIPSSGQFTSPGGVNFSVGACELLLMNAVGGYKNLTVNVASNSGVGFNITLDTNPHVVIVTYAGGTVTDPANWQVFVDGVSQTVLTSGLVIPSGAHCMGARTSGSNQMTGRMRAMCAWSGVLGSSDIAAATAWATP